MTGVTAAPAATEQVVEPAPARARRRTPAALFRRVIFWIHLAFGVSGGIVILIMSVTGALLAYERQMTAWIDGVVTVAPATPGAGRMPLDTLIARAGVERAAIATVVLAADPTLPVTVRLRDRKAVLIDPYTGTVLPAKGPGRAAAVFSSLRTWHRWLGATTENRETMKLITGIANLAFLFLVMSGFYLWWPRRWTAQLFRASAVFDRRLSGKARDWNWHNTIGFWSAIPLFFVVLTAVFMSFRWPGRFLDRTLGDATEQAAARAPLPDAPGGPGGGPDGGRAVGGRGAGAGREGRGGREGREGQGGRDDREGGGRGERRDAPAEPKALASLDGMAVVAAGRVPAWKTISLALPAPRDSVVRLTVAAGNTYRPDLRTQLTMQAATGALLAARPYDSLSVSRRLQGWVRFGHTGEVFGLVGQTIAMLVSAGAALLVWTGIALAWRRWRAWMRRRTVAA